MKWEATVRFHHMTDLGLPAGTITHAYSYFDKISYRYADGELLNR